LNCRGGGLLLAAHIEANWTALHQDDVAST